MFIFILLDCSQENPVGCSDTGGLNLEKEARLCFISHLFIYREIYIKNQQNGPIISSSECLKEGSGIAGYRLLPFQFKTLEKAHPHEPCGLFVFPVGNSSNGNYFFFCFPALMSSRLRRLGVSVLTDHQLPSR